LNPAYQAYETQLLTGASRNKELGAERATRKPQPRDYRSRALPLELSRRHGAGCQNRPDHFLFTKRAHRQQCLPGKAWSWRGEPNPGFILTKDVSCPTGRRQQCGAGGVTRKLNHRVTNAALFLLSYTSGYGAGDRTRTGVWTLARSHLSRWKTPASWSGVRESNSSGWFGRPVPKAFGQPRLKTKLLTNLLFSYQRSRPPTVLPGKPLLAGEQLRIIRVSDHLGFVACADHSPPVTLDIAWRTAAPGLPRPLRKPRFSFHWSAPSNILTRRNTLMTYRSPAPCRSVEVAVSIVSNLTPLMAEIVIVRI
jgi:hypothetical protein